MSAPLTSAVLVPLKGTKGSDELKDSPFVKPVVVQFNPASLRLQLSNSSDRGSTQPRQKEQSLGQAAVTLSFDLHFDTADTGADVRDLTLAVRKFVVPMRPGTGSTMAPPRVSFQWGKFRLDGLMQSITEEIDLFSPTGVPLHAKLSVSISEQKPELMASAVPPGDRSASSATPPGVPSAPPGSGGVGLGVSIGAGLSAGASLSLSDSTGVAIGGETAADFAARMGLDPSVWRGLGGGLDNALSLPAGLQIDFNSGLSAATGVGTSTGVESGASSSVDQRFGLTQSPSAGFALAAAGGVRAAVDAVATAKAASAASDARAAFDVPPPPGTPPAPAADAAVPGPPDQPRPRLADTGLPSPGTVAPPAPQPPAADPRATTFGQGAPLRPRIAGATLERSSTVASRVVVQTRETPPDVPPTTVDPTTPPWLVLPSETPTRSSSSPARHPATCGCGCNGGA